MSDPFAVWRAQAGMSKQKSVRAIWPELAAALDGAAGGGEAVDGEGETQPLCEPCRTGGFSDRLGVLAVTKLPDGTPICGYCVGRIPDDVRRSLRRVPGWNAGRHG